MVDEKRRTKLGLMEEYLNEVRARLIEEDQRHKRAHTYPSWHDDLSHVVEVVC